MRTGGDGGDTTAGGDTRCWLCRVRDGGHGWGQHYATPPPPPALQDALQVGGQLAALVLGWDLGLIHPGLVIYYLRQGAGGARLGCADWGVMRDTPVGTGAGGDPSAGQPPSSTEVAGKGSESQGSRANPAPRAARGEPRPCRGRKQMPPPPPPPPPARTLLPAGSHF